MNKIIVFLLGTFLFVSCEKSDPIGIWGDNIKLSTKNVTLEAQADSVTITTKGSGWWIDCISVNDSNYCYYTNEDINLEAASYTITGDYFVVEKRDLHSLFVKLDDNTTGKERTMTIFLEAGDYFDHVSIKQTGQ